MSNKPLYFINGRWYQTADHCRGLVDTDYLYYTATLVFTFADGKYISNKVPMHRWFTDLKDICNYLNEVGMTDYPAAYIPHVHQIHSTTDVVKFVDTSYLRLHNGKD